MTSMISSNKIMMKERLMNHMKERIKTTTPGSILPVTGKNGLDLKKNTQGNVQNDRKELSKVVLEQSGSSTAIKNIVKVTAAAVQRLRAR